MFDLKDIYDLSEEEIIEHFLPAKDMELDILQESILFNNFFPLLLERRDLRFFDYLDKILNSSLSTMYLFTKDTFNWAFEENWDRTSPKLRKAGTDALYNFPNMSEEAAFNLLVWFLENWGELTDKMDKSDFYTSIIFYKFSEEFRATKKFQDMLELFHRAVKVDKNANWNDPYVVTDTKLTAYAWLTQQVELLNRNTLYQAPVYYLSKDYLRRAAPEFSAWLRDFAISKLIDGEIKNTFNNYELLLLIVLDEEVPITTRNFVNKEARVLENLVTFSNFRITKLVDCLDYKKWEYLVELVPEMRTRILEIFVKENFYITPNLYYLLFAEAEKYIDDEYVFKNLMIHPDVVPEQLAWAQYKFSYSEKPRYKQKQKIAKAKIMVENFYGEPLGPISTEQLFSFLRTISIEKMRNIALELQ